MENRGNVLRTVVETRQLGKRFGAFPALDSVNLSVPEGSIFGFLGPNGAGKTTAIRILMGLLRASSGEAQVLGADAWRDGPRLRRDVGYLPGDIRFNDFISGAATLHFLDGVRGGRSGPEIARLAERFNLDLTRRIRTYSRGMRQKLGLIQALMHRPRLLILDEPTTALDPLIQQMLFEELRDVSTEGRTILFSSHTLSEVDHLCDSVAILRDGRLIEQDSIEALRKRSVRNVELEFFEATDQQNATPPPALHIARRAERSLHGSWTGPIQPLLQWLGGLRLEDVRIAEPSLEDLFLGYYGKADAPAPVSTGGRG